MVAVVALRPGAEPFPGYKLSHFIGQGGWGEVWKAKRPDGSDIALKFLPCDSHKAASKEIRALQSIRTLRHPNIIKIQQIWANAGYVVVGMELAEGNLLDLLNTYIDELSTTMPADHIVYYLLQAASALDFMNARQHLINGRRVAVRHCDVKPSNLLVFKKSLKVSDFSFAVQSTSPNWYADKVGTLSYAAPEVFQGFLSEHTDQYSLAISYYQLRTAQLPFDDTPSQFNSSYHRPVPELSLVSTGEQEILMRALNPTPHDRWPSCTEMIQRLGMATKHLEN